MRFVSTAQLSVKGKKKSHLGRAARRARQRAKMRLHAQSSVELRDSDGSELIPLRCGCYTCFISGDGGVLALTGLSVDVPISIFYLSLNLFFLCFSCHLAVAVGCCCKGVLQAREAESTVLSGQLTEGRT